MMARIGASRLVLGLRTLLAKELRSRSRGWRSMWVLTVYLGLLALLIGGFLALMGQATGTVPTGVGTSLFSSLALGSLLLLAFITPALTTGAISGERERRTLDLLLVTRASPLGLVAGKLVGSLTYVVYLIVAALPGFALVYLFGGIPLHYLMMVLAVLLTTAVAHAALGLFLSALLKRTVLATVATYFVVLTLMLGIPFISAVLTVAGATNQSGIVNFPRGGPYSSGPFSTGGAASTASPPPPPFVLLPPSAYRMVSPMASMGSVLPSGTSGGMPLVGSMVQMAFGGLAGSLGTSSSALSFGQSTYTTPFDPSSGRVETVIAFAPWVYHFAFSWSLAIACVLLAGLAVAPVKPWQAWLSRRRLRRRVVPQAAA
jgi:ABC-type transport system involved in multi-copper enzyme maturation permease subunit